MDKLSQYLNIAKQYLINNQFDYAIFYLKKILEEDPENIEANELIGQIYFKHKYFELTATHLKKVCSNLNVDYRNFYYLGSSLLELNSIHEAIQYLLISVEKNCKFFEGLHDLATCYASIGDYKNAYSIYTKCLTLNNHSYELFYNIGRVLDELKNLEKANSFYEKAISIKPDFASAIVNKAINLNELKKYTESISYFEKALAINPDLDWIMGDYLHVKTKIVDWNKYESNKFDLIDKVKIGKSVLSPFVATTLFDDPEFLKVCAEQYSNKKYKTEFIPFDQSKSIKKKIRLGYFSADFKTHPISFLIIDLILNHNRDEFEIYGFSLEKAKDTDPYRTKLVKLFDFFYDIDHLSDHDAAIFCRNLNIDIAIDLSGYTQGCRPKIFSYRVASIQINYLGYLGTTGSKNYEYTIADNYLIPNEYRMYYSEKIIYLPTYQINSKRAPSEIDLTKSTLNLEKDAFVFCCFNNTFKITPQILNCWIKILKSAKNSVLLLYVENDSAKVNIKNKFLLNGISHERIIFFEYRPYNEYLSFYQICDLFLDTYPYNAGTTASDALSQGVPVLTLQGQSFQSRIASSLLGSLDLHDLITNSFESYEDAAIKLANDPALLNGLSSKLKSNIRTSILFNSKLFTQFFEKAMKIIYKKSCINVPPCDLIISDLVD